MSFYQTSYHNLPPVTYVVIQDSLGLWIPESIVGPAFQILCSLRASSPFVGYREK